MEKRTIFDLYKRWCESLKWILLAVDRDQYKSVFNVIYNVWIPWKSGIRLLAAK